MDETLERLFNPDPWSRQEALLDDVSQFDQLTEWLEERSAEAEALPNSSKEILLDTYFAYWYEEWK